MAGFTSSDQAWLPIADSQRSLAVSIQEDNRHSVLHAYRDFMHFRKQHPELIYGDIEFLYDDETTLVFTRQFEGRKLLIALNCAEQNKILPTELKLTPQVMPEAIQSGYLEESSMVLLPCSALFAIVHS